LLAAAAGCQSNSERDLIARERRRQEDQIYALQDYINQYQQLVCRYRSENSTLKRQLSDGCVAEGQLAEPDTMPEPRPRNGSPATRNGPRFQTPQTPSTNPKQRQPEPVIESPDVPPLKTTTDVDPSAVTEAPFAQPAAQDETTPHVLATSFDGAVPPFITDEPTAAEHPADDATAITVTSAANALTDQSDADTPSEPTAPARNVKLFGEVVANDAGGGPRVVVHLAALDKYGRAEALDANVSLVLVAPGSDGQQQALGRWDFGPDDVRAAFDESASEPEMKFHIELPAETPLNESTQLCVRIAPQVGAALFALASVDLTHPGAFTSETDQLSLADEAVAPASFVETATPMPNLSVAINEGAWATAQPGKPANLPAASDDAIENSGWRTSSDPLATVVASSTASKPKPIVESLKDRLAAARSAGSKANLKKSGWSPDRPGLASRPVAARPSWSPSR
jgi:hypothetical protein